jgi:hypothetical protein
MSRQAGLYSSTMESRVCKRKGDEESQVLSSERGDVTWGPSSHREGEEGGKDRERRGCHGKRKYFALWKDNTRLFESRVAASTVYLRASCGGFASECAREGTRRTRKSSGGNPQKRLRRFKKSLKMRLSHHTQAHNTADTFLFLDPVCLFATHPYHHYRHTYSGTFSPGPVFPFPSKTAVCTTSHPKRDKHLIIIK